MKLHLHPLLLLVAPVIVAAQSVTYSCPGIGDDPKVIQDSLVQLSNFAHLCTLTRLTDGATISPVARSYNGRDWEVSAGDYAATLEVDCEAGPENTCLLNLGVEPSIHENQVFVLTSYQHALDAKSTVARFLERASFGASMSNLNDWDYTQATFPASFSIWIQDQLNVAKTPLSSHREFYRRHLNPRLDQTFYAGKPGPSPCSQDSRWRSFAFSVKDSHKTLTVSSLAGDGATPYVLSVDGYPRTIVPTWTFAANANVDLELDTPYEICWTSRDYYKESFGEPVSVKIPGASKCFNFIEGNPLVDFSGNEGLTDHWVDLPEIGSAELQSIDDDTFQSVYFDSSQSKDEFILTQALPQSLACDALPKPWSDIPVFGKTADGEYLLYDPRLVLNENTIENPLLDGGGQLSVETDGEVLCSNAPRTFLNEDHCVLSTEPTACSPETSPTLGTNNAVVVCGSLGEVKNEPSLGSGFDVTKSGQVDTKLDDTTPGPMMKGQK
jgi:hypothetical protein